MEHRIPDGSEVYWDGLHYDLYNGEPPCDLPFYLAEARKAGGPVLELACGTGRLTIPLAAAGVDITGVDVAAPMLARARAKAREAGVGASFERLDMRDIGRLKRRFGLVFIAFNSLQHLHDRASLERFFGGVRKVLAPGGRFILDVFNPDPRCLVREGDELLPVSCYKDPATGIGILVNEQYSYDRKAQVSRIVWHYKRGRGGARRRRLNLRCFYPAELEALLHYNGFRIERVYGNFDRSPFSGESGKQIVICRKRALRPARR